MTKGAPNNEIAHRWLLFGLARTISPQPPDIPHRRHSRIERLKPAIWDIRLDEKFLKFFSFVLQFLVFEHKKTPDSDSESGVYTLGTADEM